jgi:hypothetical protein
MNLIGDLMRTQVINFSLCFFWRTNFRPGGRILCRTWGTAGSRRRWCKGKTCIIACCGCGRFFSWFGSDLSHRLSGFFKPIHIVDQLSISKRFCSKIAYETYFWTEYYYLNLIIKKGDIFRMLSHQKPVPDPPDRTPRWGCFNLTGFVLLLLRVITG